MSSTLHECLLSFFGWVIRGSFMASILVLLVLMLQFLLKNKLEVRWKYLLWIPVVFRLLLPWAPESSLSLYNVFSLEAIVAGNQPQSHNESTWHSLWRAGRNNEAAARLENSSDSKESNSIRGVGVSEPSHESGNVWDMRFWRHGFEQMGFANILVVAWILGILFFSAKTGCEQLRLKRAMRAAKDIETPFLSTVFHETKQLMGVKREVKFLASELVPGPAVVGFGKPAIVISPSLLVTLQKDQLQYILAHEFAHIQRRDVAVNWIMHILLIFHWFNPLLWLAVHKARQDQEMACDACVLDRMSSQQHVQQNHAYGQTIIHVLEHFSGKHHHPGLASLSSTHKQMKRRLIMIKQFNKKSYRLSILGLAMILTLGSVSLVNAKESKAASAPQKSSAQIEQGSKVMSEGEKLEKAEQDRINKLLEKNPDDTYLVYVSKELTKEKDQVYIMGNGYPRYDKYEDYLKKAASLKEATPQQPADLPKGYAFVEAQITGPYSTEYAAEMKAEAKKLGKEIYSKKIDWKTSNWITVKYKKGEDFIELGTRRLDEIDKKTLKKGYVYKSTKDMKKENPNLTNPEIREATYRNFLNWIDDDKSYQIATNPGNPLTKEDLIKLAKTMVKK